MLVRRVIPAILASITALGTGSGSALAAVANILSPRTGQDVSGTVEISVGFESDTASPITRIILSVDGDEYALKVLDSPAARGVASLLWDSTGYPDGNRGLSVYLFSRERQVAKAYVKIQARNMLGGIEGPAPTPAPGNSSAVKFHNLRDGERVQGTKVVQIVPDSSLAEASFVAVFVDRDLKYISNRAPFEYRMDTLELGDGTHLLEAQIRDDRQNTIATNSIKITVENRGTLQEEIRAIAVQPSSVSEAPSSPVVPLIEDTPNLTSVAARAQTGVAPSSPGKPAAPALPQEDPVLPSSSLPGVDTGNTITVAKLFPAPSQPGELSEPSPPTPLPADVTAETPNQSGVAVLDVQAPGFRPSDVAAITHPDPAPEMPQIPRESPATDGVPLTSQVQPLTGENANLPTRTHTVASLPADAHPVASPDALAKPGDLPSAGKSQGHPAENLSDPSSSAARIRNGFKPDALWEVAVPSPLTREPLSPPDALMAKAPVAPAPEHLAGPMSQSTRPTRVDRLTYATSPQISHGTALIGLRRAVETLGGSVTWEHTQKVATATIGDRVLTIDMRNGEVRAGAGKMSGVIPILRQGRTIISARAIADSLGLGIEWYGHSRNVKLVRALPGGPGGGTSTS